jgi:hypothetical protein
MHAPGHSQPWSGGKLTEPVSSQSGTAQASDILPDKPPTWQVTLTFDTSMFEDDVRRTVERALTLSERYRRMKTELEEIDAAAGSAAEKGVTRRSVQNRTLSGQGLEHRTNLT